MPQLNYKKIAALWTNCLEIETIIKPAINSMKTLFNTLVCAGFWHGVPQLPDRRPYPYIQISLRSLARLGSIDHDGG